MKFSHDFELTADSGAPIREAMNGMYTYTVFMNVTLSIDEQTVARARKKAEALGKSLNQLIRDYLQRLAGGDDPERSIEEFERLSGHGNSRGWKFNRGEIHERS
jgi:hypothetical protein